MSAGFVVLYCASMSILTLSAVYFNACGLYHGVVDSLFDCDVLETTRICVSVILDFERSVDIIMKESKYRKVSQASDERVQTS